MTNTPQPTFPMTLKYDPAGGTAWVTVGATRDINGPNISRNSEDVGDRSMTTYYMEAVPGMMPGPELSFDVTFDPIGDNSHAQASGTGLLANFETSSCTLAAWQLQLDGCGGTATWTFDGFLTDISPSAPLEGAWTASVSVKISGKPTLAIT